MYNGNEEKPKCKRFYCANIMTPIYTHIQRVQEDKSLHLNNLPSGLSANATPATNRSNKNSMMTANVLFGV